ncbi:glycine/D-amino acid oxidase-like deaminating enzyme [Chitinophaga niastensis]|uniref:Glycine/D-amino acid oxidase-like deaminating enzyme n=1 Tax=Chitinophaga niastensis TaxID=536980 RepID=A0A2P8HRJ0_CHINA|nr:FAD-binding oxidoreductase [Chitinophaga niastensis]PSL48814.1 glycine/D-amino acid oxidase-like deaminating enzyme [Chitinophaga niastensis]
MKKVDYLIVGQGIAGTMLSWFLLQAGKKVIVIDDAKANSASRVAAGIINPVSGRRFEPAWLYDTLYPFAKATYLQLSALLEVPVFTERELWTVFPSQQMRDAFLTKTTGDAYTELPSALKYEAFLDQPYGAAIVKGATVNLRALLPAYRRYLQERESLLEQHLDLTSLEVTATHVLYGDVQADKIIFCDGVATTGNPFFSNIKFLPNKGEVLLVKVPGLVTTDIIKKGITLVPQEPELFWAGSSFVWDYENDHPTARQREILEKSLQQLLKLPYEVQDQLAAVRPSGNDRRPIAGLHPEYPAIGIFNGLGTKGCSLAPFMAAHFVDVLAANALLMPEIDVRRYFNILRG